MALMKRFILFALCLGVSINMAKNTPAAPGSGKIIVGLGDSTTAGTPGFFSPREAPPEGRGNPESQYAFWLMKAHPEWQVLNRGVRGQRTDQILSRFDYDVMRFSPEAVILLAGVNDLHQGRSAEETQKGIRKLVERSLEARLKVILCTVLPYNMALPEVSERLLAVNVWIRAYAAEAGISFCDTAAAVSDPANPARLAETPDRIHPGVDGYRRMAEVLSPVLEDLLKEGKS